MSRMWIWKVDRRFLEGIAGMRSWSDRAWMVIM